MIGDGEGLVLGMRLTNAVKFRDPTPEVAIAMIIIPNLLVLTLQLATFDNHILVLVFCHRELPEMHVNNHVAGYGGAQTYPTEYVDYQCNVCITTCNSYISSP